MILNILITSLSVYSIADKYLLVNTFLTKKEAFASFLISPQSSNQTGNFAVFALPTDELSAILNELYCLILITALNAVAMIPVCDIRAYATEPREAKQKTKNGIGDDVFNFVLLLFSF